MLQICISTLLFLGKALVFSQPRINDHLEFFYRLSNFNTRPSGSPLFLPMSSQRFQNSFFPSLPTVTSSSVSRCPHLSLLALNKNTIFLRQSLSSHRFPPQKHSVSDHAFISSKSLPNLISLFHVSQNTVLMNGPHSSSWPPHWYFITIGPTWVSQVMLFSGLASTPCLCRQASKPNSTLIFPTKSSCPSPQPSLLYLLPFAVTAYYHAILVPSTRPRESF